MQWFKQFFSRFFRRKPFFYSWEQRKFERRREQSFTVSQNACRPARD